ncbi:phosphate ABC transporter permease subunit PstC [Apilactobacillus micheneri]|uniref:phosphate ABC transporter permease subunit PstC n=1 Tax=Apilactobacillus micheneri TaxID=1899430 RepID=UPI000D51D243|nr:phosphate ABC transporter permease subunit PstC [Apilactobacillus micheneri]GAY80382.1 phosphate transport system permease protein PstC 1 [Apilactobacillus micheneri]
MEIKKKLLRSSKETRQDKLGKGICYLSIGFIILLVSLILYFIISKGLSTFTQNNVNIWDFLIKQDWSPSSIGKDGKPEVGALPMIITSFGVTILSAILATPFAIAIGIYMSVIAPKKGRKFLQIIIEILVGIPSVVYGFLGLTIIVPMNRHLFGGTGFGILSATLVLFVMVLPTITSLTFDSLNAVPKYLSDASLALGATRWQTIYKVILRAATPGILTAIIFGMARAFGEALAVQMVIGNATLMPKNLITPASTLTSQLTTGIGNTVMGTLGNNALWSLALVLLLMSLVFNIIVKIIGKRGSIK